MDKTPGIAPLASPLRRTGKRRAVACAAIAVILFCFPVLMPRTSLLLALPAPHQLSFAVIQLELSDALCSSGAAYERNITSTLDTITDNAEIDLAVFPEYTSAPLGVARQLGGAIAQAGSLDDLMQHVQATCEHPKGTKITIPHLLSTIEPETSKAMDRFWGSLARENRIFIIAGTYFALDEPTGELRNRAVVYDPTGRRVYEQDKVYLTPFEVSVLGLSPGRLEEAETFPILGTEVALTLCRDTFFDSWESQFSHAGLWFDLKANGTTFDAEEARSFATALPERISHSGVRLGATVCLTGKLLDMYWEGESSIIRADAVEGYKILQTAQTPRNFAVILWPPQP